MAKDCSGLPPSVFVALDFETTGLDKHTDEIIEIGAVRFHDVQSLDSLTDTDTLNELTDPRRSLSSSVKALTGITDGMLEGKQAFSALKSHVQAFLAPPVTHLIAHNLDFETAFLERHGIALGGLTCLDTFELAYMCLPEVGQLNLIALCRQLSIPVAHHHRAYDDALGTGYLFMALHRRLAQLPDVLVQQILAHSRQATWDYATLWQELAIQRKLEPVNRNRALQPDDFPVSPRPPAAGFHALQAVSVPPGWSEGIRDALEAAPPSVLTVPRGRAGRQALAEAGVRWIHDTGRRLLLCLPRYGNDPEQAGMMQALDAALQAAPDLDLTAAYLPDAHRHCDLARLNAWKAGRTLDHGESRFLSKVLYWETLAQDKAQGIVTDLRQTLDLFVLWPQVAGTPEAASDTAPDRRAMLPALPPCAGHSDLLVMDHETLFRTLHSNPDFIRDFDGIIIDDIWHLVQGYYRFFTHERQGTRTQTVYNLTYCLDRLRALADNSPADEAAQWLRQWPGCQSCLDRLAGHLERVTPVQAAFEQALTALIDKVRKSRDNTQQTISFDLTDAVDHMAWNGVWQQWQKLDESLSALCGSLEGLMDALPAIDADEEPQPALYMQQIEGWSRGLRHFQAHLADMLGHTAIPAGGQEQDRLCWIRHARENRDIQFNITSLWNVPFIENCLQAQDTSLLFLYRGYTNALQQGFLSQQLDLDTYLHSTVSEKAQKPRHILTLLPADLPDPNQPDHQQKTEALLPAIGAQVPGCTLVMFTWFDLMQKMALKLRPQLDQCGITALIEGQHTPSDIMQKLVQARPVIFFCTLRSLTTLYMDEVDIQCLVLFRLPFPSTNDLVQQYQTRHMANSFKHFTLPSAGYTLLRAGDLLSRAPDSPGVLVLLDRRIRTQWYRDKLRSGGLPRGPLDEKTELSHTAQRIGDWLAPS